MNFILRLLLFIAILAMLSLASNAQEKFYTDKGKINFTSSAELETIKAASDKLLGVLDPTTNQFAFSIDMSSFNGFNSALQKEHFMENYIETDIYPKGTFKGKIIEQIDFSQDGTYDVRAKGDLEIHGMKQNRILKGTITIAGKVLSIDCHFTVPLSDHNIQIPKIVNQKIATEILVDMKATLAPKK